MKRWAALASRSGLMPEMSGMTVWPELVASRALAWRPTDSESRSSSFSPKAAQSRWIAPRRGVEPFLQPVTAPEVTPAARATSSCVSPRCSISALRLSMKLTGRLSPSRL